MSLEEKELKGKRVNLVGKRIKNGAQDFWLDHGMLLIILGVIIFVGLISWVGFEGFKILEARDDALIEAKNSIKMREYLLKKTRKAIAVEKNALAKAEKTIAQQKTDLEKNAITIAEQKRTLDEMETKNKKLAATRAQLSKMVAERKAISSQKALPLSIKVGVKRVSTLLSWPRNPKEKYFPLGEIDGIKVVGNRDNPKYPANAVSVKKELHRGVWDSRIVVRNATVTNLQMFFSPGFVREIKKCLDEMELKNDRYGQEGDSYGEQTWVAKFG